MDSPTDPLLAPSPRARALLIAQVAVDHPIDSELTYRVPEALVHDVVIGSRVVVPLGRGNRLVTGTVMSLAQQPIEPPAPAPPWNPERQRAGEVEVAAEDPPPTEADAFAAMLEGSHAEPSPSDDGTMAMKDIAEVVREIFPVPADLLDLGRWLARYYCTPIGITLSTMVPAAVKKATRMPMDVLVHLTPAASSQPDDPAVKLSPKARKAMEILAEFLHAGPQSELATLEQAAIGKPLLKRLAEKGFIRLERRIHWPEMESVDEVARLARPPELTLTTDQQTGLADIHRLLDEKKFGVRLVYGVTGSGKTELYIRAIERVVKEGKRAIVLVPEISLTPQTVKRFTQRFERVAVLHSGLKASQRHLHWHAIATGWAQVIVGARSAVFAPAMDIGIIVVDEEHDPSYKQDAAPRYHGRDVAIRRAQQLGIPVLLGSATPALESWHNAHGNPHFGLISLPTRPLGVQMPRIQIVDMHRQAKERRGLHILSTHLEHHLKQTLEHKRQAIFLLNRRGYAHYIMCPRCNWVFMCENCDSTMVVHRTREGATSGSAPADTGLAGRGAFNQRYGKVQCHYCETAMLLPQTCPLCQAKLTHLGQGTQRAEDELLRKFPGLRLARMDSDSMRAAADYQETLSRFAHGDLDLLIGTQMIAKGLDFPNVQLVGVLNSDLAMTMPDFRAAERTFQLICQVAGRSGRSGGASGDERGTVVVQTFQPQEPAIVHACNHDYEGFVAGELPHRKQFGYPPFGRMVRLVLSHKGYTKVHDEADALMREIVAIAQRLALPVRWHGPQPPPMERLVEQYRVEIVLFAETAPPLQRLLAILRTKEAFSRTSASLAVDVDPVHMM